MAWKFPEPGEVRLDQPYTFCDAERVKKLYKSATGEKVQRIGKTVRKWFEEAARERGWGAVLFLRDHQTEHSAGYLLVALSTTAAKQPTLALGPGVYGDADD